MLIGKKRKGLCVENYFGNDNIFKTYQAQSYSKIQKTLELTDVLNNYECFELLKNKID